MKRSSAWGLLLCFLLWLAACARPGEKPNLVLNPGLEVDANHDSVPDHWSVPKPSDYPADWHVGGAGGVSGRSTIARSGKYSIMYSVPSPRFPEVPPADWWDYAAWERLTRFSSGHWSIAFRTDDFPVKEYHLYRARCYVKAENVLTLHVKFIATFVYPGRKKPVVRWIHPLPHDPNHKVHKSGTWDWEEWETVVPVPEFVERGRIEFWVREWAAPAKLFCDDMSVIDAGPYPFFERKRKQPQRSAKP